MPLSHPLALIENHILKKVTNLQNIMKLGVMSLVGSVVMGCLESSNEVLLCFNKVKLMKIPNRKKNPL